MTQNNRFCFDLEEVYYLHKKFANDQATAKMDPTILGYTETASIIPM